MPEPDGAGGGAGVVLRVVAGRGAFVVRGTGATDDDVVGAGAVVDVVVGAVVMVGAASALSSKPAC